MSIETVRADASQGWTLVQALERTADPQQWAAWLTCQAALQKAVTPIPSGPGSFLRSSPEKVSNCRKAATAAFEGIKTHFREILCEGALYATGSRGDRSVIPAPIYREGWRTLRIVNFEKSIVQERSGLKQKIYNVRIFPLIHADDVCDLLSGSSIGAAFKKCVLQDPEVISARKWIQERGDYTSFFEQGQFPGLGVSYKWPIGLTGSDLASYLVRPVFIDLYNADPKASPGLQHVCEIIADRWNRLCRRLCEGDIAAQATFVNSGVFREIDRFQWGREGLWVDVKSGDLLEEEGNKPTLRWSGISLFHVKPLAPLGVSPATITPQETAKVKHGLPSPVPRLTPQRESTKAAISSIWPTGIPSALSVKARDKTITDWQRKKKFAVVSSKTISRYLQRK